MFFKRKPLTTRKYQLLVYCTDEITIDFPWLCSEFTAKDKLERAMRIINEGKSEYIEFESGIIMIEKIIAIRIQEKEFEE